MGGLSNTGGPVGAVLSSHENRFATSDDCRLSFAPHSARAVEPVDADHAAKMAKGLELFKDRVRPVLLERCFKCHGSESVESGFDMTDRDKLLKGGDSGAVVVPHKSAESLLCKLITHEKKPFMPHEADKLPVVGNRRHRRMDRSRRALRSTTQRGEGC